MIQPDEHIRGRGCVRSAHLIRDAAISRSRITRADTGFAWLGRFGIAWRYEEILGYLEQACRQRLPSPGAADRKLAVRASRFSPQPAARRGSFRHPGGPQPPLATSDLNVEAGSGLGSSPFTSGSSAVGRRASAGRRLADEVRQEPQAIVLSNGGPECGVPSLAPLRTSGLTRLESSSMRRWTSSLSWATNWDCRSAGTYLPGWFNLGRAENSRDFANAASHARLASDAPLEMWSLVRLATSVQYGSTPVDSGLALCHEVLDRVRGQPSLEADVDQTRGNLEAMRGNFEEARAAVEHSRSVWRELGNTSLLVDTDCAADIERSRRTGLARSAAPDWIRSLP
jgi:hypothetical protein